MLTKLRTAWENVRDYYYDAYDSSFDADQNPADARCDAMQETIANLLTAIRG